MVISASAQDAGRRRQGVKAGLDLAQILSAAASIAPDGLTMQAVADRLGVDRKAVNHYVSDRETLLRLVAVDAFTRSVASLTIPADCDWRDASRIFGRGIATAVTALGPLAGHIVVSVSVNAILLAATEALLASFVEAGLDLETGLRAISMLNDICDAHGRGVARLARDGTGKRDLWLHEALRELPEEHPQYLGAVAQAPIDTYDPHQLDFSIETFIRGLEGLFSG